MFFHLAEVKHFEFCHAGTRERGKVAITNVFELLGFDSFSRVILDLINSQILLLDNCLLEEIGTYTSLNDSIETN